MKLIHYTFLFTVFFLLVSIATLQAQQKLIWSAFAQGQLYIGNTDGTQIEEWATIPGSVRTLALDKASSMLYYAVTTRGTIHRMNLNTRVSSLLLEDLPSPEYLTLDQVNQKMYWGDGDMDVIMRANLDGTEMEEVFAETALNPQAMVVDTSTNSLIFGHQSGEIDILQLDSFQRTRLTVTNGAPTAIVLDASLNRLYWTVQGNNRSGIEASDLDGENFQTLFSDGIRIHGLTLDATNGELYWTDWGGGFPKAIRRTATDGSNLTEIATFNNYSPFAILLIDDALVKQEDIIIDDSLAEVFPNPTAQYLHVKLANDEQNAMLRLYDNNGKLIATRTCQDQLVSIDIHDLPSGTYWVQLQAENRRKVQAIVIQ